MNKGQNINDQAQQVDNNNANMVSTSQSGAPETPRKPKVWTRAEINSMSIADYEKYREEIDLAQREGRVR
jgi:hypothetical protein